MEHIGGGLQKNKGQQFIHREGAPSKFQFFNEMDALLGGHYHIVFPVVGTTMGLDVRRPDAPADLTGTVH